MGQEFPLPVTSQFFGTVPDPAWKMRKYSQEWQPYDTVNATIGQGYMLASPLQLGVMAARLATGNKLMPRLLLDGKRPSFESMDFHGDHVQVIQKAMSDVINGPGTAGRARLPIDDVLMAGKTGTAQVVSLSAGGGRGGRWQYRDHGLFIFFAPFDKPRYAGAVVIEHGGGSGAAYPVARDVMTFLFDPSKGLEALYALEKQWGGTAQQRMAAKYAAYATAAGIEVPPLPADIDQLAARVDAEARADIARTEEARHAEGPVTAPPEESADGTSTPPPSALVPEVAPSPAATGGTVAQSGSSVPQR
jgi:penicillin-binding protein 2